MADTEPLNVVLIVTGGGKRNGKKRVGSIVYGREMLADEVDDCGLIVPGVKRCSDDHGIEIAWLYRRRPSVVP